MTNRPGAFAGLGIVGALLVGVSVPQHAAADVTTIVQRWTDANRRDFEQAPQYSYDERIRTDDGTKTYAVDMLLGSPYRQLIAEDGKPIDDERAQQDALSSEMARRKQESADEQRHRMEKYQRDRTQAHRILEEMPHAFEYRLSSTRQVTSRTVYVLNATPRRGYDPPNVEARVLTGMRGEFWIDSQTYQLLHGSATVLHEVSIAGDLATIQPGTDFEVEQRPVGNGIWLPTHFSIRSRSHIMFLFHHHMSEDRTYFGYHPSSDLDLSSR